jgi:predicted Zn-dependent protease
MAYLSRTQYDPGAALDVFTMLDRRSRADNAARIPDWLSTHPAPSDRRERLAEKLKELPAGTQDGRRDRDIYLQHIANLVYGEDPRNGYFDDNEFIHPALGFRFEVPPGWQHVNLPEAVVAQSPDKQMGLQLTLVGGRSANEAAQSFYRQSGISAGEIKQITNNGLPLTIGTFSATTEQGQLVGIAAHLQTGDRVYQMLGLGAAAQMSAHGGTIESAIRSFRTFNPRQMTSRAPHQVKLVTLARATSLAAYATTHPSPVAVEELALLNGVAAAEQLPAGRKLKWIQ